MAVAAPAKGGVLGLADGITLDCDPRPVVDCVAKAGMGGHSAHDKLVLADRLVTGATPHMHRSAL